MVTDNHIANSSTAKRATELGLPLFTLEDVYHRITTGTLECDVATSFVYWRKIKQPLLGYPKYGIINFHPAPLPEYRGTAGYNLAILNRLDRWSVTAHYVDKDIDTGGIIDAFEFSIDSESETAASLEATSQAFMLGLYRKTLNRVAKEGSLRAIENLGGRYVSRAQTEEMKQFSEGDDIDRQIRAFWFPPYTGAFVEIAGVKYTLINEFILKSLVPGGQTFQLPTTGTRSIPPAAP
ncbi:formyltransferase family protein [Blastococcus sp. Marseille-P5729]|uniref:formyltransferase family protein n=1 Tax=Blastococcus sp. Marseille-P5729 TaxID=2086582 RepID=UPI0018FE9B22|nr:formyltransferase family protein [Blastococcus sp. Marseille-P5729]